MIVWWNSDTHTHTYTHIFVIKKKCSTKSRRVCGIDLVPKSKGSLERSGRYLLPDGTMQIWIQKKVYVSFFYRILLLLLSFFFGEDENPFRRGRRRSSMIVCTQQRMRRTFSLSIASTTGTHICLELSENVPNQFPQILESCFSQSRRRGCSSLCRVDTFIRFTTQMLTKTTWILTQPGFFWHVLCFEQEQISFFLASSMGRRDPVACVNVALPLMKTER